MHSDEDIFLAAAALPAADRPGYLDGACAGEPEQRARVEALLRSHEAEGFMENHTFRAPCGGAGDSPLFPLESPGQRIGRYRLIEPIGEGGFGVVWMAEQVEPVTRRVALKLLKPGLDTREVIARFEAERQALAQMDHPGIAKVFDAGTTELGRPYFVMELVRGVRITDFCDQSQLPTFDRLRLFIAVCEAVQHAHQKGIIHRDLKPSNILVAPGDEGRPQPKVIDFGVAKALRPSPSDESAHTRFEQMIGTPAYMSPEQAGLGPMDIDTRSDVYSLGVLLYELLAGAPPFDPKALMGAGLDEMRRIIREVEPPRPSTRVGTMGKDRPDTASPIHPKAAPKLASALRGDLDWIVMKAMEKTRARRYESANGLAADVERFLRNEPVLARPPGFGYRARKVVLRNKGAVAAAAAVLMALLAGIGVSTASWLREKDALAGESALREEAENGRRAAQVEFDKHAQTASFLNEMLAGLTHEEAKGMDITLLRKILDNSAEGISTGLEDQPEVRANLHAFLGQAYQRLGLDSDAGIHLEKALELYGNTLGADDPDTLGVRRSLDTIRLVPTPKEQE